MSAGSVPEYLETGWRATWRRLANDGLGLRYSHTLVGQPFVSHNLGGNFVAGDGGDTSAPNTYDGCALSSKHNVVVVTMNYRVRLLTNNRWELYLM